MTPHDRLWRLIHTDNGDHRGCDYIDPGNLAMALNAIDPRYRAITWLSGWGIGNKAWSISSARGKYRLFEGSPSPLDADMRESDSLWELIANMPIAPAMAADLHLFIEAEKRGRKCQSHTIE